MLRTVGVVLTVGAVLLLGAACGSGDSECRLSDAAPAVTDVSVHEAEAMVRSRSGDPTFVILDVRTPAEFAGGHIDGAVNLDVNADTFEVDVAALDRSWTYLVHCHGGSRSPGAVAIMVNLGFQEIYHMAGGITAWIDAGYPTVP